MVRLLFNGGYPSVQRDWTTKALFYYINSSDYKIEDHEDSVVVNVLVAGVDKKDIKASLEDAVLTVQTEEKGWNGTLNAQINLYGYKIDLENPKIKLSNNFTNKVFQDLFFFFFNFKK